MTAQIQPLEPASSGRTVDAPAARLVTAATAAAVAVPPLLAYNLPPASTFFNQAAALGLWGLAVVAAAAAPGRGTGLRGAALAAGPLVSVLGIVAATALAGWAWGPLPQSLALTPALALGAAVLVLLAGASGRARHAAARGFLFGWVAAGVVSAAVALVQLFAAGWADGDWIAHTTLPGRAVGNLRQPNHLGTLLLWSAIALVPLVETARVRRVPALAIWVLLVVVLELTGSRTAALGVGLLALWGLLDRRLGRFTRALLVAAPLVYALAWAVAWWLAQGGAATLGAATRAGEADLSSSRFAIWSNAVAMVAMQPWTGVGFGRFNFAWSLTPFPDRPVAFFDHAHNLPLHFAVELGLPLAVVLTALLVLALWRLAARAMATGDVARRALVVMLLLVGVHSMLEYPLWYLHFLLPAVWACGAGLAPAVDPSGLAGPRRSRVLMACGAAMALGACIAVADYLRVARIFTPPLRPAPLTQRITEGQRSPWFAHHADYALVTVGMPSPEELPAARRAAHHLLDTRLTIAWARALAASGDLDRARHLAQRLREFRNPASHDFFAPCDGPVSGPDPAPFQCQPPDRTLRWQDFER